MTKRVRPLFIVFSLCLSLTISGCGLQDLLGNNKKSSSKNSAETQTLMAVSLNEEDPNKLLIVKGIEEMAKKENVKVKYLSQSKEKEDTKESPLKGAKVLIYQGGDPSILQTATTESIPVLALSQVPAGVKLVGLITPDQEKAGELMAQTIVSKVAEGQIVILQGDPNESGSQERLAGNKAILSKYPKIVVQTIVSPPGTETTTKQSLLDFLQKNPNKVLGIMAHNEKLAAIANEVLKQTQLESKIILVGGQASIPSLGRMASGTQVGDVDTSPYLQGLNAFQWAQKIIKKETLDVNDSITSEQGEIPAKIIQVKAVTPENLAVIQKSYAKTIESAEQDKKKTEEKDQKASEPSQEKDQASPKKEDSSSGDKQPSSGGDQAKSAPSAIPAGAKNVTERIKTETTREYLDAEGKVIGTEKTANDQVKTVPAEMMNQQAEQSKDSGSSASKDAAKETEKDTKK